MQSSSGLSPSTLRCHCIQVLCSRLVEVVGGRVKAALEMEPAYLSQPVGVAAHSPRRTRSPRRAPSRSGAALGPLASCSSFAGLSPSPSSGAL